MFQREMLKRQQQQQQMQQVQQQQPMQQHQQQQPVQQHQAASGSFTQQPSIMGATTADTTQMPNSTGPATTTAKGAKGRGADKAGAKVRFCSVLCFLATTISLRHTLHYVYNAAHTVLALASTHATNSISSFPARFRKKK
jgi:TolA-binding protein